MKSRNIYSLLLFLLIGTLCSATIRPSESVYLWEDGQVRGGDDVVLHCYRPENPNGIGVIVCPGGSYYWLDAKGEGYEVAQWLVSNGYTAFVLLYRTAGIPALVWGTRHVIRGHRYPDTITDAQRALQYVWEHTEDYGIDKDKIGMMGFSAGGHLVMSAACYSETNFLTLVGVETEACLKPAFVAPIYPVVTMRPPYVHRRSRRGLLGDNRVGSRKMRDSLSLELHIPADCPPVFIANCVDDPVVDYRNSEILDEALTEAGIPHKYIQYAAGKHGFGVSEIYGTPESRKWKYEFLDWLSNIYE